MGFNAILVSRILILINPIATDDAMNRLHDAIHRRRAGPNNIATIPRSQEIIVGIEACRSKKVDFRLTRDVLRVTLIPRLLLGMQVIAISKTWRDENES